MSCTARQAVNGGDVPGVDRTSEARQARTGMVRKCKEMYGSARLGLAKQGRYCEVWLDDEWRSDE